MLGNRKLVLDTFCEVHDLLNHWTDEEFWEFESHDIVPGAVYLIGRDQFNRNVGRIRQLIQDQQCRIILSNPAEGSETIVGHLVSTGMQDLAATGQLLIIGGGDMDSGYCCLQYDSFLPKIQDYKENIEAMSHSEQVFESHKPWDFLFLNGRHRNHRRYLINRFRDNGTLKNALWTCLDTRMGEIRYLPTEYEYPTYCNNIGKKQTISTADRLSRNHFAKHDLFGGEWGEIYINPRAYIDTYFSVVTETVFDYPYSFRTEKIWKPIAMCHPWIAVANQGYYRDMHNLGFKTFGHLIDESFDQIENNQDRLERVALVIEDLCQQDLASFLKECYNTCKYNQQHLLELGTQVRQDFPNRFQQFIQKYHNE
jgi:hypothetical protein